MEEQRIFSLDEANEIVPLLALEFERIHRLRRHIGEHFELLEEHGVRVDATGPLEVDEVPDVVRKEAVRLNQMVKEIGSSVERMNEAGCLVRDLDVGLIDFYSIVDGDPVYLCWQYGEPEVGYFHGLDESFQDRRRLSGEKSSEVLYN